MPGTLVKTGGCSSAQLSKLTAASDTGPGSLAQRCLDNPAGNRLQAHRHCCLTWIFCVKWNMRDPGYSSHPQAIIKHFRGCSVKSSRPKVSVKPRLCVRNRFLYMIAICVFHMDQVRCLELIIIFVLLEV